MIEIDIKYMRETENRVRRTNVHAVQRSEHENKNRASVKLYREEIYVSSHMRHGRPERETSRQSHAKSHGSRPVRKARLYKYRFVR